MERAEGVPEVANANHDGVDALHTDNVFGILDTEHRLDLGNACDGVVCCGHDGLAFWNLVVDASDPAPWWAKEMLAQ